MICLTSEWIMPQSTVDPVFGNSSRISASVLANDMTANFCQQAISFFSCSNRLIDRLFKSESICHVFFQQFSMASNCSR